jgi:ubiquinone/menaquinone biosynthesis C-methylase UbiE
MMENWNSRSSYETYVGRCSGLVAPRFLKWSRALRVGDFVDVGCGIGVLSRAIVEYGARRVIGIDTSSAYVSYALASSSANRSKDCEISFELANATQIPHRDNTFDSVVSGLVLNFLEDPKSALVEMRKVTKLGGVVVIYVWDYSCGMEAIRIFLKLLLKSTETPQKESMKERPLGRFATSIS